MTADISDLLSPDLVAVDVSAATKKALLAHVGALAASSLGLDGAAVATALTARERQGSTGYGGGVAVPDARVEGLARIVAVVVRTAQPVDYGAVDDAPVDILVALLSPPTAGSGHLKALSRVASALRDTGLVAKLRGAGSRDAIWALLTEDAPRDAA